ncbi:MAG: carbamate kinase [Spirochaetes bacterium DG_61]|nr:MAG: carbamate kinase [Spirochaetes bacterium DG_61]
MGGHAFMLPGEKGTIDEHQLNAAQISAELMHFIDRNYNLVITHGNGPQVGNLLLMTELTGTQLPPFPLDVLVAQTEGSLGYIMQQALLNELAKSKRDQRVVTVVSQVLVKGDDPAFQKPTKPIGPFLSKEEAEKRQMELGWKIIDDSGRGWRRVVPSPVPQEVVQYRVILDSVIAGHIVIACGGGGIPVIQKRDGGFQGIEAVIDKDLTSAVLGNQIKADLLVILTEVPNVYLNYGKPDQRSLGAVTVSEMNTYMKEGHFPAGSMGPKVHAIISFLTHGGKRGLITSPQKLSEALEGRTGTHFVGRY